MRRSLCSSLLGLLGACALQTAHEGEPIADVDPSDLEPYVDEKTDGTSFDPSNLASDAAFTDDATIDAAAVQSFFERTPYGTRSFLADLRLDSGERASAALVRVAREHDLNPLVLVVKLQKEMGLVSKTTRPARSRVDFALGCGCPDGSSCSSRYRGFDRQLDCAADVLSDALDDLARTGRTSSGWGLGVTKRTLDRVRVTPRTRATAALYHYTPWVLEGRGGNWLFRNLWLRYARSFDYEAPGATRGAFIGDACTSDTICDYTGGFCGSAGFCTARCTRFCPDRAGSAPTFCVDDGSGSGLCVSQCSSGECASGLTCTARERLGDPATTRAVCLPP